MTGLDWFQARTLARSGTAVRLDAWRKWLTFESYVWLITQPVWEEQEFDRRVEHRLFQMDAPTKPVGRQQVCEFLN
jgi:hypothetical protein